MAHFIRFGAYPTVVPEETIASINRNLAQNSEQVNRINAFKPGERVIIDDEGFEDFEAVFKCEASQNRSIILVNYIERVHEVSIKNEKLRLVKAS